MTSPATTIPFTVIGGYLGTGKTTLLNHLLKHCEGRRLALLINDFGAINIDASLIESATDQQINLTNGCVCCGLSAGFDEAIESLLSLPDKPDHIIVEASGVADVQSLAQYGHGWRLHLDGVLVVADAETVREKASDKYVAETVKRQLRAADLIVLNKADLVGSDEVIAVTAWLRELAQDIPVIPASYCDLPASLLLGVHSPDRTKPLRAEPAPPHDHHELYATWKFEHAGPLNRDSVEKFITSLPEQILRAKGYFRLNDNGALLYQQVGKRRSLTGLDSAPDSSENVLTQIVAIGLQAHWPIEKLEKAAQILREGS